MLLLRIWKLAKPRRFTCLLPKHTASTTTIPTAQIPGADELPVGQRVYLQGPGGQPIPALVVEVTDETVTFDLNHEMAGKDLNFEITLVEVVD